MNSGIQFPGESIEYLLKINTNIDDDSLADGVLIVEFKMNKGDKFAFQFLKN